MNLTSTIRDAKLLDSFPWKKFLRCLSMSKFFCPTSRKYSFWVLRNSFFFNLLRLGVFRNLLSGFSCISVILILLAFYRGMDSVDFGLNSTFNSLLVSSHNLRLGIVLFGIFVFIIHHVLIINFTLGFNRCLNYEGTIVSTIFDCSGFFCLNNLF